MTALSAVGVRRSCAPSPDQPGSALCLAFGNIPAIAIAAVASSIRASAARACRGVTAAMPAMPTMVFEAVYCCRAQATSSARVNLGMLARVPITITRRAAGCAPKQARSNRSNAISEPRLFVSANGFGGEWQYQGTKWSTVSDPTRSVHPCRYNKSPSFC